MTPHGQSVLKIFLTVYTLTAYIVALYATGVYVGVQLIEGYVLTPLIEMHVVSLPPALLIAFQLLMGLSAGIIGLFMATPLLVTLIVVIQAVYVRDILDEDVKLIGEDDDDGDDDDKQLELELAA